MNEIRTVQSLTNAEIMGLRECFSPVLREYKRGEIITIFSPNDDTIGIIVSGIGYISTNNFEDQRRILDYVEAGEIFGSCFFPKCENNLYYIQAKTACKIEFIKRQKLLFCCENNCSKHIAVINHILALNAKRLLMHTDILCQQSLRSKLLSFFEHISVQKESREFTLPLPLSDLADYLSVDRSAMMRELRRLNDEKVIESNRNHIIML